MPPLRALAAALAAALLAGASASADAAFTPQERARLLRSGSVDAGLVEAFDSADEVAAVVVFERPGPRDRAGFRARLAARRDAIAESVPAPDLRVRRRYGAVNALAVTLTRRGLLALARHPHVKRIGRDGLVRAQLGEAVPLVGLDTLHVEGYEGQGIHVAIVDTGINPDHEDLVGSVIAQQCFCEGETPGDGIGCCQNGTETQSGDPGGRDSHGHGTRVAGIVASNGTSAPRGGAPQAKLLSVRVLDNQGHGTFADVTAGLDWVLTTRPDVQVVNMSLGGGLHDGDCDDVDATTMMLAEAIAGLRENGVVVVAGAGNDGAAAGMIAPACVAGAISVGAVWDEALGPRSALGCFEPDTYPDLVTCFSNGSSTTDVFAPGAIIESSLKGGGSIARSGTSYATPLVSACGALVKQKYPWLPAQRVEAALVSSTTLVTHPGNGLSYPRLDCPQALAAATSSIPALPPLAALLLGAGLAAAAVRRARPQAASARRGAR